MKNAWKTGNCLAQAHTSLLLYFVWRSIRRIYAVFVIGVDFIFFTGFYAELTFFYGVHRIFIIGWTVFYFSTDYYKLK